MPRKKTIKANTMVRRDQFEFLFAGEVAILLGKRDFPFNSYEDYEDTYNERRGELIEYMITRKLPLLPDAVEEFETLEEQERILAHIKEAIKEAENAETQE
jgi:hypothetical protein